MKVRQYLREKHISTLISLILFSLAHPLWAVSDPPLKAQAQDSLNERPELKAKPESNKEEYALDPGRRDWENGYYKDMYSRYRPLNGMDPGQLGNGGGRPPVYFKVKPKKSDI